MDSSQLQELHLSLGAARSELSPLKARDIYTRIVKEAKALYNNGKSLPDAIVLAAAALSDLAILEVNLQKRLYFRRESIEIHRQPSRSLHSVSLLVSYANRIVDHFYDNYAREERPIMAAHLAQLSQLLKVTAVDSSFTATERAMILAQRSSILRCQAMISSGTQRISRVAEAVRCAERAVSEAKISLTSLELGQAFWASARWANSDEDCFTYLQHAETALIDAQRAGDPLASLVLSRFYRQTYRPAQAVEMFFDYELKETKNRRRLLSEVFLLGEASMQLWYNNYESSFVEASLTRAYSLLSESVDAGYEVARNFAALAFVQAALGRNDFAEATLHRLSPDYIGSWLDIMKEAQSAILNADFSALKQTFALGIEDASIWNALGTYSARFVRDDALALRLYDVAKRLEPRNAVTLTNIARTHIRIGKKENLIAADEALQAARDCAPRTFTWWRAVRDDLESRAESPKTTVIQADKKRSGLAKLTFNEVQSRYSNLRISVEQGSIEAQRRGYLIQHIIQDLLKLTFRSGEVLGSHRVRGGQVDAAFTYLGEHYRVEVKWEGQVLHRDDLDALNRILEQAEVRGIVISMSGFAKEAVEYAADLGRRHAVLLVDKEEMDLVFAGRLRFESLIEWKLVQWRQNGNPYARRLLSADESEF